ncbi:Glycogen synthase [subsurface metagenome]
MTNEKHLKILFIPAWYPTKQDPVNGTFIREYAKAVSLYNDVVVLYSEGISHSLESFLEIKDNKEDGLRTIRLRYRKSPIPKTTYFIYLWSIFRVFRKLIREGWKPDIIHAYVFSAGVPAVLLGKIYKMPVIITELYTNFATHSLVNTEKIMAKFAMNRAKYVLPISRDLMEAIENYYNIKNKFMVIPCVVNTEIYFPLNAYPNRKKGQKKMLSVCILSPRKGIDYLLKSLYQLKQKRQDFILDIVGDGPKRKEYEELTEKLALSEIVKFYGRQPEIVSFMRNCDFFVLPSLYENFGVVYIEAMACGKPVIGTLGGGPKEIINKDTGILVLPKNIEALSSAIEYMLDHYQDYSSKKISQYAKENFSYEVVGKKIDRIYRKVIL